VHREIAHPKDRGNALRRLRRDDQSLVEHEVGVRMATVSLADGEARILYDPVQIGEERLIAVVERPGYRVTGHAP
jgi:copper chaperone CopZ